MWRPCSSPMRSMCSAGFEAAKIEHSMFPHKMRVDARTRSATRSGQVMNAVAMAGLRRGGAVRKAGAKAGGMAEWSMAVDLKTAILKRTGHAV